MARPFSKNPKNKQMLVRLNDDQFELFKLAYKKYTDRQPKDQDPLTLTEFVRRCVMMASIQIVK